MDPALSTVPIRTGGEILVQFLTHRRSGARLLAVLGGLALLLAAATFGIVSHFVGQPPRGRYPRGSGCRRVSILRQIIAGLFYGGRAVDAVAVDVAWSL